MRIRTSFQNKTIRCTTFEPSIGMFYVINSKINNNNLITTDDDKLFVSNIYISLYA